MTIGLQAKGMYMGKAERRETTGCASHFDQNEYPKNSEEGIQNTSCLSLDAYNEEIVSEYLHLLTSKMRQTQLKLQYEER
jgi:hypothetical protein